MKLRPPIKPEADALATLKSEDAEWLASDAAREAEAEAELRIELAEDAMDPEVASLATEDAD